MRTVPGLIEIAAVTPLGVTARPPIGDVVGLLDAAEATHPERAFLIGDVRLSYRQAAELTRRAAAWLARAGVRRGDRVLIVAANRVEVILLVLAAVRLGAIFAILHEATRPRSLAPILAQVRPIVTAFDRSTAPLASLASDTITVGLDGEPVAPGGARAEELFQSPETQLPALSFSRTDPLGLVYTSGSTGVPRGVVVSHSNVVFTTAAIQERLRYRASDVVGVFLPLSFDYGLYQVFLAANVGAALFLGQPGSSGPPLLKLVHEHAITVLPVVPSMVGSLIKLLDRTGAALPSLRCLTSTGDHLPEQQVEELRRRLPGTQIYPMYGLTECKRVSILLPEEWPSRRRSVGRPLIGTTVQVIGPDGHPLPPETPGEIVVSGRHVTLGYWQAPDETCQRFGSVEPTPERQLRTGDVGWLDATGFLYVLGRADSLLKHRGFRISAAEVEAEACRVPGVLEAGLVATPGDELHLAVRTTGDGIDADRIRRHLLSQLEWFKVPERIHLVDDLPRTPNQKLDRRELAALLSGGS